MFLRLRTDYSHIRPHPSHNVPPPNQGGTNIRNTHQRLHCWTRRHTYHRYDTMTQMDRKTQELETHRINTTIKENLKEFFCETPPLLRGVFRNFLARSRRGNAEKRFLMQLYEPENVEYKQQLKAEILNLGFKALGVHKEISGVTQMQKGSLQIILGGSKSRISTRTGPCFHRPLAIDFYKKKFYMQIEW